VVPDFVTTESPATPAPIAPCGCTNVSSCGKSRRWHKVQASNQRAYFAMLAATMPDVDAEGILRESTGFGRDIPANLGPAVPPDVAGPAEAHEIMQRVTGQPGGNWPTAAERAEKLREQLVNARLFVRPSAGEIKASDRMLADADNAVSFAIRQHLLAEAKRTEQSLTESLQALGLPAGDAASLELRTAGDVPVAVNVIVAKGLLDGWPELVSKIGDAMKRLAEDIAAAVRAAKATTDQVTGERTEVVRECHNCGRSLLVLGSDGSRVVETFAAAWQRDGDRIVCADSDPAGCQYKLGSILRPRDPFNRDPLVYGEWPDPSPELYQATCRNGRICTLHCPLSVGCAHRVEGPADPDVLLTEDGKKYRP
jgi:hypothetical protein